MLQVDTDVVYYAFQPGFSNLLRAESDSKRKVAGSVLLFNSMAVLLYFPCCPTGSVCVHQEENRVDVSLGWTCQEDVQRQSQQPACQYSLSAA